MTEGWEIKKLGDVCDKASSNVSQNQLDNEMGNYPIYGASGFIKNVSFFHHNKPYLSIVKDGSGYGRVTKMDAYTSVIGTLQYLLPKENVDINYLYYYLLTIDFKKYVAGAAIPHIYFKDYSNEPILWMPLPEQQRIVSILDNTFAAIDKAKANLQQNLQNAKELFESYLQNVFAEKGEGWEEKRLGDVCLLITDGKHGDCENQKKSGFYFLSAKDVRNDTLLFDNARQITKEGFDETHRRTNLKPGDICMVNTGATIGRISLAPDDPRTYQATFQKSVAVIKTIPSIIDNFYCLYLLKSDLKKLVKISAGTAVPNLLLGDLKRHTINLPTSIKHQQIIVKKLNQLSFQTKKAEKLYEQKLSDLDELKKSILQKAFAGELTAAPKLYAAEEPALSLAAEQEVVYKTKQKVK
jgi:type I restriction enzyme S subunit